MPEESPREQLGAFCHGFNGLLKKQLGEFLGFLRALIPGKGRVGMGERKADGGPYRKKGGLAIAQGSQGEADACVDGVGTIP